MKGKDFRDMKSGEILVVNRLSGLNRMKNPPNIGDIYVFHKFHLMEPFSVSYVYLIDNRESPLTDCSGKSVGREMLCFSPSIDKNLETLQKYRSKKLHQILS